MNQNNDDKDLSVKKESFVRWQGRTIEELGKAINLILSLCLATIGFVIAKLLDKDLEFQNCSSKTVVIIGTIIILSSTTILLILIYNRLLSFRSTAQIARKREKNDRTNINELRQQVNRKDKYTWSLFGLSVSSFLLGELFIIIGFIIEVSNR